MRLLCDFAQATPSFMRKKAAVTLDKLPLVAIKNTVMAFHYKDTNYPRFSDFWVTLLFSVLGIGFHLSRK